MSSVLHLSKTKAALAALTLLALSACGSDSGAGASEDGDPVTLTAPTWAGGQANAAVAAYILEEELGYDVTVKKMDEDHAWEAIGDGRADAILEDWGHPDLEKKYIDKKKTVKQAGDLGVKGRIGWYVPEYLSAEHTDITKWRKLNDYSHLFRTPETGGKGRLLEGSPKFVTRDEELIKNLKLDFKAVYAGSEDAQIKEMRKRAKDEEPFLTYWWRPHWLESEVDLTEVELPPHYNGCDAVEEKARCGYPETELQKYLNADFDKDGGKAAHFLRNFQWGEEDQNEVAKMIARDGLSPEKAAKRWAKDNKGTWKVWLWDL
ncbi:glycine/betaine ABC transporter substrate-binding protein [Streptomyces armeniacus]|uniref:Glycine/betaine ABC transporter substrate-binding protein n=1 Tax=Streptomyces armeniacus TaxID=83291 RepID=A0A345XMQ3_9ACTN|nr:ABC transporter substrate-binding protein [Streptomyces armeniacus]AXK32919.1 glycine/betaine ABC transporter substrate-binding protein [Streptomyces armeniacus]